MSLDIIDETINCSDKLDDDDLFIFVEREIIRHHLLDEIKEVHIVHDDRSVEQPFIFHQEARILTVNSESLQQYLIDGENSLLYNKMVLNYFVTQMILEVELRFKSLDSIYDQDLKEIIRLQRIFEDPERRFDILESNNPSILSPLERYARVMALYATKNEFNTYESSEQYKLFMKNYGRITLNGYEKSYPLKEYFSQYSKFEGNRFLRKFYWYNKDITEELTKTSHLPLSKRIVLGMPIDVYDKKYLRKRFN